MHVRRQVRDAFVTALTGLSGVTSIHSGRAFALNPDLLPAISVSVDSEDVSLITAEDDLQRIMDVRVMVSAMGGDQSDDVLDAISVGVENAIEGASGEPWDTILICNLSGSDFTVGDAAESTVYTLSMRYRVELFSSGPESIGA